MTIEATHLHCDALPEGDNGTHHFRPLGNGTLVCVYCGKSRSSIVAEETARRELAALNGIQPGPSKINLRLWQITIKKSEGPGQRAEVVHFYLDADLQGIETSAQAVAYTERVLGGSRWDSITAFLIPYTITKD